MFLKSLLKNIRVDWMFLFMILLIMGLTRITCLERALNKEIARGTSPSRLTIVKKGEGREKFEHEAKVETVYTDSTGEITYIYSDSMDASMFVQKVQFLPAFSKFIYDIRYKDINIDIKVKDAKFKQVDFTMNPRPLSNITLTFSEIPNLRPSFVRTDYFGFILGGGYEEKPFVKAGLYILTVDFGVTVKQESMGFWVDKRIRIF